MTPSARFETSLALLDRSVAASMTAFIRKHPHAPLISGVRIDMDRDAISITCLDEQHDGMMQEHFRSDSTLDGALARIHVDLVSCLPAIVNDVSITHEIHALMSQKKGYHYEIAAQNVCIAGLWAQAPGIQISRLHEISDQIGHAGGVTETWLILEDGKRDDHAPFVRGRILAPGMEAAAAIFVAMEFGKERFDRFMSGSDADIDETFSRLRLFMAPRETAADLARDLINTMRRPGFSIS